MSVVDTLDRLLRADAILERQIAGLRPIDSEKRCDEEQREER